MAAQLTSELPTDVLYENFEKFFKHVYVSAVIPQIHSISGVHEAGPGFGHCLDGIPRTQEFSCLCVLGAPVRDDDIG